MMTYTQVAPFQPKGAVAVWRQIYEFLKTREVGDVITYADFDASLGFDVRDHRSDLDRANKEWNEQDSRSLVNVRGVGYKVAIPAEHEAIARDKFKRGLGSIARSHRAIKSADRSLMSPDQKQRFDRIQTTLSRHEDVMRRQARDISKLQSQVDAQGVQGQEMVARLAEVERKVAAMSQQAS